MIEPQKLDIRGSNWTLSLENDSFLSFFSFLDFGIAFSEHCCISKFAIKARQHFAVQKNHIFLRTNI